jgi:hypothetical protein
VLEWVLGDRAEPPLPLSGETCDHPEGGDHGR